MKLHTLYAWNHPNITDEGIKNMCKSLRTLDASYNPNITDEGIKNMKLHTLYSSYNPKITYYIENGIKIPK